MELNVTSGSSAHRIQSLKCRLQSPFLRSLFATTICNDFIPFHRHRMEPYFTARGLLSSRNSDVEIFAGLSVSPLRCSYGYGESS